MSNDVSTKWKGLASVITFLIWMFVLFVFLMIASLGRFVDEDVAIRALRNQGFNDIQIVGKHIWFVQFQGCGVGDAAKFDIEAVNPRGYPVQVYVCAGFWVKGATIRSN